MKRMQCHLISLKIKLLITFLVQLFVQLLKKDVKYKQEKQMSSIMLFYWQTWSSLGYTGSDQWEKTEGLLRKRCVRERERFTGVRNHQFVAPDGVRPGCEDPVEGQKVLKRGGRSTREQS